jgi:exodeoxyribonuclease VII small subunit
MTDETYTFEQTRVRLEGILVEVRKKDTSLEQSLELLEEGVRLLNQCNELIDQTAWRPSADGSSDADASADGGTDPAETDAGPDEESKAAEALEASEVAAEDQPEGGAADPADEPGEAEELPDDERD